MRTPTVAVAALVLAALGAVPARADAPEPTGDGCGLASGPTLADDASALFVMNGGPIVATGDAVSVTLTCTYQREGIRHADADTYAASVTGSRAAVLAPTAFEAPYAWNDFPVLCTEVTTVDAAGTATTFYWDADVDEWSGDSGSSCQFLLIACPDVAGRRDNTCEGGPFDPFESVVDPAICPVLVAQFPPDGDVEGLWDCPPYGS